MGRGSHHHHPHPSLTTLNISKNKKSKKKLDKLKLVRYNGIKRKRGNYYERKGNRNKTNGRTG